MTGDEELDAILATLGGELDDAELDRRAARFQGMLRRLREDPAEAARIDALVTGARDDPSVIALVTRAAQGDPVAWDEIVQRYAPLVWSICGRFQLSASDREDVAQTVWLLVVDQLGTLREPAALPGWLATTTRRECLRVARAARKSGQRETLNEELRRADDTAIEQEILIAERHAALRDAFAELPPRCQQLLSMLLADPPYSYAEISVRLNIPVGSIGPHRGRCLERLRRSPAFLADYGEKPSPESRAAGQVHEDPSVASAAPGQGDATKHLTWQGPGAGSNRRPPARLPAVPSTAMAAPVGTAPMPGQSSASSVELQESNLVGFPAGKSGRVPCISAGRRHLRTNGGRMAAVRLLGPEPCPGVNGEGGLRWARKAIWST